MKSFKLEAKKVLAVSLSGQSSGAAAAWVAAGQSAGSGHVGHTRAPLPGSAHEGPQITDTGPLDNPGGWGRGDFGPLDHHCRGAGHVRGLHEDRGSQVCSPVKGTVCVMSCFLSHDCHMTWLIAE